MIQHTVVFTLKYPKGSAKEKRFLEAALQLASIPGVLYFKGFRQISKKNPYKFGLSMEFESKAAYDAYNQHPDHRAFLTDFWSDGVADFLELDYEPLT
jgi:quinol monooxygenase YgiN